jgi:hypothetical protein
MDGNFPDGQTVVLNSAPAIMSLKSKSSTIIYLCSAFHEKDNVRKVFFQWNTFFSSG